MWRGLSCHKTRPQETGAGLTQMISYLAKNLGILNWNLGSSWAGVSMADLFPTSVSTLYATLKGEDRTEEKQSHHRKCCKIHSVFLLFGQFLSRPFCASAPHPEGGGTQDHPALSQASSQFYGDLHRPSLATAVGSSTFGGWVGGSARDWWHVLARTCSIAPGLLFPILDCHKAFQKSS